jgi:hypothetical protein
MYFYLVLDGNPLCSFLTLQAALETAFPLLLEGRNAQVIRMKEWCASALADPCKAKMARQSSTLLN